MMRTCAILVTLACFLGGMVPGLVLATSLGNPLLSIGKGNLSISAEWEQRNRTLDLNAESEVMSNRYWLKGTYGMKDWLDVFGTLGFVDFDITTLQDPNSISFENRHLTFGFGGGFKVLAFYDEDRDMTLHLNVNGLHLRSQDFEGESVPDDLVWNEFQASASLARQFGFAIPFCGLAYSLVDGELDWSGSSAQDFRDPGGLAFAGMDFLMPGLYVLSLELNGRIGGNWDEISFSVGLSQSLK